ncbi:MAG: NAD(P)H-binding protein [Hyphomicrobium sp.]
MRPIKKIAMIGATGMIGIPVAIALMEAGFEVTALVRNPEQARRSLPAAIAVVEADVRDEESLRAGLAGQDGVYLNLSVTPGARKTDFHTEVQGLQHIIGAARDAKIERLAYVSALIRNTDCSRWWVIDVWRQALARIRSSGVPYTIFYPTNFMETLAQRHSAGRFFMMLGRARYRNYWIAGRDFGEQVARSFALPIAGNREYVIQGPEPLTYDEAAARYTQALLKPQSIIRVPLSLARLGGLFSRQLDFSARIMQAVLSYPEEFKAAATWAELGKPTTTIEQFANGGRRTHA